jgi:hypothetical protein
MPRDAVISKYLNPWKHKRLQQLRLAELRRRDGDNCSRCRRPLRFDLPEGHDQGAKIEQLLHSVNGGSGELQNLCLTHGRCNPVGADHTPEVTERVRRKNEAELFAKARKRQRRSA